MKQVKTALMIEDDPDARDYLKDILEKAGFKVVVEACDGTFALSYLESATPDLIVCDWSMPVLTGLDVLKFVRQQPKLKNIPFVMLTADATVERVTEAMRNGARDYLLKSCSRETIERKFHVLNGADEL